MNTMTGADWVREVSKDELPATEIRTGDVLHDGSVLLLQEDMEHMGLDALRVWIQRNVFDHQAKIAVVSRSVLRAASPATRVVRALPDHAVAATNAWRDTVLTLTPRPPGPSRPSLAARLSVGAALLFTALTGLGCSGTAFTEEMRAQETEMSSDTDQWNQQLAQWEKDDADQTAWHQTNPVPASDATRAEAVREHGQKLAGHDQELANFRHDLEQHRTQLQQETSKPEKDRTLAHAALWAEHEKLKAQYALIASAHERLVQEHAQLVTGGSPKTSL